MLSGGSRALQHLSDYHHHHTSIGLGFCGAKIVQLSSFFLRPSQAKASGNCSYKLRHRMISSSGFHYRTSGETPIIHSCFSQREDDLELPADGSTPVSGGIVALGKFDALHVGHRELAIQASRVGTPYLLSFVGMAEVFGWEPRAPIVAKCDRKRVLTSWDSYCGNKAPVEYEIEFASVRHLTPRQFVEKLSKELRVCGVVAGENYRFGYKASGDASELVRCLKVRDEQPSPHRSLVVPNLVIQVGSDGGEKENVCDISYVNKERSYQCSLQSPGKNFYLNRLQYIEHDPTGSQRVVSLPELLHPVESISQIFIATFTSDILWFLTGCGVPSHLPVTVACHHAERCWSSSPDSGISAPLPNYPNVVMVFPPFPEEIAFGKDRKNRGIACHHPKLFILQREDSVRVIITSANLVARQWDDVTNTVWWQDFPRRANPDYLSLFSHFEKETNHGLRSDFGAQLAGFAATLLADVPSQAHWILEFTKYNFEHSAGHLVASVPGVHSYKPSYLTESARSSTAFNEEFLGSVEASVVGLSYLFRSTSDSTGAQLKRLASYISRTSENPLGMLELVMRRNTNVPADVNAVSVLVPNPDDDSRDEFVQLGFLPRNIAKWVSPLWDIGFFKFVGYVYRDEVLAAASCRSNQKVQLMLHVLQGVSISEMPKLIQPHHVVALCSLVASLQRCTGIWRLQEVLGCYKWPESQESDFVYSASSVGGSVTAGFQADFASAAGKKVLQHVDSQESDPEWGCWSAREEREAPSIKIIFPTIERVKNGLHGVLSSRRLLCFSEKTWQKLRYNNVLHDAVPNPQDRVGHPMHIKVARRRFTSTRGLGSSSFGWVYCGSHNFSAAAWGQTISRSSRNNQDQSYNATRSVRKLRVCNYELGIVFVFPPPHEETDSCDGSKIDDIVLPFVVPAPKYGVSDRPATGLAMREALAEFREGSRSVFGESEVEEVEEEEEDEAEAEVRGEFVAEEEKQEEKAYGEALWSQVESSLSS